MAEKNNKLGINLFADPKQKVERTLIFICREKSFFNFYYELTHNMPSVVNVCWAIGQIFIAVKIIRHLVTAIIFYFMLDTYYTLQ